MSKVKAYRMDGDEKILMAIFETWQDAEQCSVLLSMYNIFDYFIISGNREKRIRSRRRVLCPGCGAEWTYGELKYRREHGDKLCDCGTRFYTGGLKYDGEKAEAFIK